MPNFIFIQNYGGTLNPFFFCGFSAIESALIELWSNFFIWLWRRQMLLQTFWWFRFWNRSKTNRFTAKSPKNSPRSSQNGRKWLKRAHFFSCSARFNGFLSEPSMLVAHSFARRAEHKTLLGSPLAAPTKKDARDKPGGGEKLFLAQKIIEITFWALCTPFLSK